MIEILNFFNNYNFQDYFIYGFHYSEKNKEFFLIIDKPIKSPKNKRTFIKITFKGVYNYKRKIGISKLYNVGDSYQLSEKSANIDIQDLKITYHNDSKDYSIDLYFGVTYGEISFYFKSMFIEELVADVDYEGNGIYYNEKTNEIIDFYNPFNIDYQSLEE